MTRWQRHFHTVIWPVLGGLIAVIIVAGVLAKAPQLRADYQATERSGR